MTDTETLRKLVSVKPLEWKEDNETSFAEGAGAEYLIELSNSGRWYWEDTGNVSREAAKSAAQADYEARILAALTPSPAAQAEAVSGDPITMTYRNYRGEVDQRTVIPLRIWWGSTDWHPEPGWLMSAYDQGKMANRDFALADCQFAALSQPPQPSPAAQEQLKVMREVLERLDKLTSEAPFDFGLIRLIVRKALAVTAAQEGA